MNVLLQRHLSPSDFAGATDVIAPSGGDDETTELLDGVRVHLVAPHRGWLIRALGPLSRLTPTLALEARALEKLYELTALWGHRVDQVRGFSLLGALARQVAGEPGAEVTPPPGGPVGSVELVCCTYNRLDEPLRSLPSMLAEAAVARAHGLSCVVRVVYQNDDFPHRLFEARPQWRTVAGLSLLRSDPPSLPRARNTAVAHTEADLVIFVDDDVELDRDFVLEHVAMANRCPTASGIVGRIRSKHEGHDRQNPDRAVGQFRPSGWVDGNFDSVGDGDAVIAPHTPRGANMAFRRAPLVAWFGSAWFDESLLGSAHREESTLALEVQRRGGSFVYAPRASLYHFEAELGGCENRQLDDPARRLKHLTLDHLFLNRFYAPLGDAARRTLPLLTVLREVKHTEGGAQKKWATARLGLKAWRAGQHFWAERRDRDRSRQG